MTQMQIIFLGTGGSWPSVRRNVTSIALKRGREIILFDCGEGTQRQFQKSHLSYMQISKIFISHFHGDHFLGLPGLIQTMQLNDRNDPLFVYGPKGMLYLLDKLLSLGYFKPSYPIIGREVKNKDIIEFDGYNIKVIEVDHGIPSVAYCLIEENRPGKFNKKKALELGIPEGPLFNRLQKGKKIKLENGKIIKPDMVLGKSRPGRKIVYSGDTKPFEKMIKFSEKADVLIHEATFDDSLKEVSLDYGHSTATQTAEIAKKAKVKKLFIVHISPRYNNIEKIENDAKAIFKKTYIPKDFDSLEVPLIK
jgi:ribonuclease Z